MVMTDAGSWHVSDSLHLASSGSRYKHGFAYIHPVKHEVVTSSLGRQVFNICQMPDGEY